MNKRKLALVSAIALVAVSLAVWMVANSSTPALPDEPVPAGAQATHRAPDEPVEPSTLGNQ